MSFSTDIRLYVSRSFLRFCWSAQRRVHEDGVGAGEAVGLGAAHGLLQAPAGDEGLDAGDDDEVVVALGVLAGLDLAAELVDVGEGLRRRR
jgi:hypothetical protein